MKNNTVIVKDILPWISKEDYMNYLAKFTQGENPLIKEIRDNTIRFIVHIQIVFDEQQMPKQEKEMETLLHLTEEISNRNKLFWSSKSKLKVYETP